MNDKPITELEAWTIPSVQYRIPNQDTADLVNTLIQMAAEALLKRVPA